MSTKLEVIFFGMACFVEREDGGYRVLVPDGREPSDVDVEDRHEAALWIRPRDAKPDTDWPEGKEKNDYPINEPCELRFTALSGETLNDDFRGRIANLRESDCDFELAAQPATILQLNVDAGTLTTHKFPSGMKVVRWVLKRKPDAAVTLSCGKYSMTLAGGTRQVIIANVSSMPHRTGIVHFPLYRKLAARRKGRLPLLIDPYIEVTIPMDGKDVVIDPSFEYPPPPTKTMRKVIETPDGGCSPSRLPLKK